MTPGNGVAFQWDASGNGYFDSFAVSRAPAWVRLVRSGSEVSGYNSTDGVTWTQVGPTAYLAGVTETQDAGLIATSHAVRVTGEFSFSGVTVTP